MRRFDLLRGALPVALACTAMAAPTRGEQPACPPDRVPLLVLGTFHMSGGESDMVQGSHDDMGSPERQQEISIVVERLASFRPTKVAIESAWWSPTWRDRYAQWRAGQREIGPNEIEQIAFRTAQRAGLDTVWPVDFPMWMNGLTPQEQHQPPPAPPSECPPSACAAPPNPLVEVIEAQLARDAEVLRRSSLAEYLAYLNTPERFAHNHRWDVLSNLEPGSGVALYENTDLATNWYKRNLRIFTNLLKVSQPGDRVLLVIGMGHLPILSELAAAHPRYCLVSAPEVLRTGGSAG